MKDSRHAGSHRSVVYYLSEGFKADSRQTGHLLGVLLYYLSEGFKTCWESLRSAGLQEFKAGWES